MRFTKSVFVSLLCILPTITSAAEKTESATKAVLFNVGSSGDISFRFHRSELTEYVANLRFRAQQHNTMQRDPDGDAPGGQCYIDREDTHSNLGLHGGLRFNAPTETLTWFYQPEIGLVADYRSNKYKRVSCTSSTGDRPDTSMNYGIGARFSAGATYFITPEISVEGSAGFNGSYLKWNTNSDYKREDWQINSFAILQVGYHW